jgi:hypothetical protein
MKNAELNLAYAYVSATTMTGLTVEEIKKLRAARKRIKDSLDEYIATRKDIWESYSIKNDEELDAREDKTEIIMKVAELDNSDTDVVNGELKFLTEEKILAISPPQFNQNDIDKLVELLGISNIP